MKLFTIQSIDTWNKAKEVGHLSGGNGFLKGDDYDIFKSSYVWMVKQLKKRITNFSGDYPVWAWPDGSCDYYWYGPPVYKIVFEVPESRVLISNYQAWHCVLNNMHCSLSLANFDKEFSKEEIEQSWENIFNNDENFNLIWGDTLQACVDKVYLNEIFLVEKEGIERMAPVEIKIKQAIMQAVKHKDEISRDVLRLALGEIQLKSAKANLNENDKISVVKKIIKANNETINKVEGKIKEYGDPDKSLDNTITNLYKEIDVLESLLPPNWTEDQIKEFIATKSLDIRSLPEDKAINSVIKALKEANAPVNNTMVRKIVSDQWRAIMSTG